MYQNILKSASKPVRRKVSRKWLALLLIAALFTVFAGCEKTVSFADIEILADTTELVLTDQNITDFSKLKRLKNLEFLDLRGNEMSVEQFEALQKSLPDCEIVWSVPLGEEKFDSNSAVISAPSISAENAALLKYFPGLTQIDAAGNTDYAMLKSLQAQYPQYAFRWTVSYGAQSWPNDAQSVSFDAASVDAAQLEAALAGFSNLRAANLTKLSLTVEAITSLREQLPDLALLANVPIAGRAFRSDAAYVNLSGEQGLRIDDLMLTLHIFPQLSRVNLRDTDLSDADKKSLLDAYPKVSFLWQVAFLPELSADSNDTGLILSDNLFSDPEALYVKFTLLPNLQNVEMCNCGLSNEQMQSLRERLPSIKFVWMIRVGDWEMRTDVKAFSMGNIDVFPGGRFVGHWYSRYREFTGDTLQPLTYCTDLIALDIGHSLHVADLSYLAGLTKLQYLIVALTDISNIDVVRNMPELTFLEIFGTRVSDLTPLLSCKKLEYLNCSNCQFTSIDELSQLKELKRLWMIKNHLTEEQLAALGAALPDTRIMVMGKHPTDSGWRRGNEGYFAMQRLFNLYISNY